MFWDRMDNEPAKAFAGFLCYRELPAGDRSIDAAYEIFTGNPLRPPRGEASEENIEPATSDGGDAAEATTTKRGPKPKSISEVVGSDSAAGKGKRIRKRTKNKAPGYFYIWSRTFEWRERAIAKDDHDLQLVDDRLAMIVGASAEKVAEQRIRFKNELAAAAFTMLQQAREMIRWPLRKTVRKVEGEDGKPSILEIAPAKWTKQTATRYLTVAQTIGAFGLDIKEDESDIRPEQFADLFFEHADEVSKHMPPGALPAKPGEPGALVDNVNEAPMADAGEKLHKPIGTNGNAYATLQPPRPVRPETGDGEYEAPQ